MKLLQILAACLWLIPAGAVRAQATRYCVAGPGSGDGSAGNPWRSLTEMFNACADGDVVLCTGAFDEAVTLGASVNGKTITLNGQGIAQWAHSSSNAQATCTIGPGADDITLHFVDMDLIRRNTTGNCWFFLQNNAGGGAKTLTFTDLTFDHERHGFGQLAGDESDALNLQFTRCTLRYGANLVAATAGHFLGDVALADCSVRRSLGPNAGPQNGLFALTGAADSVRSITLESSSVWLEGLASSPLLDVGARAQQIILRDSEFRVTTPNYAPPSPPIALAPSLGFAVERCLLLDRTAGGAARGYLGNQPWIDAQCRTACRFADNTLDVCSAASSVPSYYAITLVLATDLTLDFLTNDITSGSGGVYISTATAGARLNFEGNHLIGLNTGCTDWWPRAVRIGESADPDGPPIVPFGICHIDDNHVNCATGTTMGSGLQIGRNVGAAGSTLSRNLVVMTPGAMRVGTQYGLHVSGHDLLISYNRLFSRSPVTLIGTQNCIVEFNSAAYDVHQTNKGLLSLNGHGVVHQVDNLIRFNAFDVQDIQGNSAVVYTDKYPDLYMNSVSSDYNWYALKPDQQLSRLNGTSYPTLTAMQAGWQETDDAHPEWSGLAGNDAHSVVSPQGIFVDAEHGDFTPTRYLRGWGAVLFGPPHQGADINDDGVVNATDLAALQICLTGPLNTVPPAGCSSDLFHAADIDRDGNVDLGDFAEFNRLFTAN